ncbi:MAG: bifunctional enoyl-CoA hydratase/phosphate acetyltransferase [Bacteroidales bacterium]|nr:bifunctional enoyl-CoA hydratase/phosphate acetyltransferase [Bacteroidales bacterium]
MVIKTLNYFVERAKEGDLKKIVVAAAADETVLGAVYEAKKEGFVEPILIGNKKLIIEICLKLNISFSDSNIIDEPNDNIAAKKAVQIIREGNADILVKGLISTSTLLKAVLDKENGIRKGALLSHLAFMESPYYHKLLAIADGGVNIDPTFEEKVSIIENSVEAFHRLGVECPKIAVVGAVETVNPKMEDTIHAAMLTQMNRRKQIKGCLIDGPLAVDNAVSKEAAQHKGIVSEVAGDADLILCPDIEAGNIMYKTMGFLGGCTSAAIIVGAKVPIVLTSRADTEKSKLMSIALAASLKT